MKWTKSVAPLWVWLLLTFVLMIVVNLEPGSSLSTCKYVARFKYCLCMDSQNSRFLSSNWEVLQSLTRCHYVYFRRAKKSRRLHKRYWFTKNLDFDEMLRSVLILWKLVLSVLRLEIGALIVKTVMFVVSTIATSVLLLSMILITFRRCVYRDSKLIVEKSSLPQSTVLCSGLLFFNCFVFNLAFPSGFNFISALIYISWYISSKKRNQFMRAINGNPTLVPLPKSISTIGNEGTFRTNHSINLESTPK
eukprot:444144_1